MAKVIARSTIPTQWKRNSAWQGVLHEKSSDDQHVDEDLKTVDARKQSEVDQPRETTREHYVDADSKHFKARDYVGSNAESVPQTANDVDQTVGDKGG